jgi:predicted peroxiredoxin
MDLTARSLVVKCTAGAEAPERLNQAFMVASLALASGAPTSLWLTGDAVWMAVPGRAEQFELPQASPLADLRDAVLAGGRISVCSQCAARRGLVQDDLIPGIAIKGSATFVAEALEPNAQALVY